MRKNIIIVLLIGLLVGTNAYWYKTNQDLEAFYQSEISKLEAKLALSEETLEVLALSKDVKDGVVVKPTMLTTKSIPISTYNDKYFTVDEMQEFSDNNYRTRVSLSRDAILTKELMYDREYGKYDRTYDLYLPRIPTTLRVGDRIDLRFGTSKGEQYIILSNILVEQLLDNILVVTLDEYQIAQYNSALCDYFLYSESGVSIYATKYIVQSQDDAYRTYPMSNSVLSNLLSNTDFVSDLNINEIKQSRSVLEASLRVKVEPNLSNGKLELDMKTGTGRGVNEVSINKSSNEELKKLTEMESEEYN